MFKTRYPRPHLTLVVFLAIALSGCATHGSVPIPESKALRPSAVDSPKGWWYARFTMKWPEDVEPSWQMDLFLADTVVSPVLSRYRSEIPLWRFHRRAARDQAGHQFSFIFYSSPEAARKIFDELQSDKHLHRMKAAGIIIRDTYDNTATIIKPNVEDTSDAKWSAPIKKSWPHFIMGVSQVWLDLIRDIAEHSATGTKPSSPEEIRAFYQKVNTTIGEMWREEGRHAFLHHLNALFGYEPLVVYEKRIMSF